MFLNRLLTARWRREPLLHFLLGGVLLLTAHQIAAGGSEPQTSREIQVTEEALRSYLQFQMRSFDEEIAAEHIKQLSKPERRRLADQFVEEEALYREALAWGLGDEDYVIRRRLVQSLQFAVRASLENAPDASDDELRRYYADHKQAYALPGAISFTHVFFDADRRGRPAARRDAKGAFSRLRGKTMAELQAAAWPGDRFLYQLNYIDQPKETIASHFGQRFQQAVFKAASTSDGWLPPIESDHGVHLVYVLGRTPPRIPAFHEVKSLVATDFREAQLKVREREALRKIVARYRVSGTAGLR